MKCMVPILWAGVAVAALIIYLRSFENRTLFYPAKEIEFTPRDVGLAFEEAVFETSDRRQIHGWFVPGAGARFTVLFCHGNAGNISHRLEKILFFHQLGCSVFIFDYRGFGKSIGRPYEGGLYRDVQAAYDYLVSRGILPDNIIGYGESLGGAVIVDLVSKNKCAGLIVESSISSAKDMIGVIFPFLPSWLFSSRLDSVAKIKSITTPKLIIHSSNDEIVPFRLGEKLYDAAPAPKEFLKIRGGHNSGFFESSQLLKEKIGEFIRGL